jgi:dynein heavy chain
LRQDSPIDPLVANDVNLLTGELSASPLETLEVLLTSTYIPLFTSSSEWGLATPDQRMDFTLEVSRYIQHLQSCISSFSGGLELRRPSNKDIKGYETLDTRNFSTRIQSSPEMVPYFETILREWCDKIQEFLEAPKDSATYSAHNNTVSEGPRGELDYWRTRLQRLTSIIEQLKSRDCKNVTGVLSTLTKSTFEHSKSDVLQLLRRWKQIDIGITEATNEAKDNVKYLSTLERLIEPLYSGTVTTVIDTFPALMNSIKVRPNSLIRNGLEGIKH